MLTYFDTPGNSESETDTVMIKHILWMLGRGGAARVALAVAAAAAVEYENLKLSLKLIINWIKTFSFHFYDDVK